MIKSKKNIFYYCIFEHFLRKKFTGLNNSTQWIIFCLEVCYLDVVANLLFAQSAGAVEYTNCTSGEG